MLGEELRDCGWAVGIDLVVPVPLHPKKEKARGFNQSALIAEGLAEALSISAVLHGLRRIRSTESQTRKTRAERIANVDGAFALRQSKKLMGKHVLLVDDVLTTGATIEACATAVLALPGTQVSVATIAIAGE
jgi:ComF family protein